MVRFVTIGMINQLLFVKANMKLDARNYIEKFSILSTLYLLYSYNYNSKLLDPKALSWI